MSSILEGISDLISGVFNLIYGVISTIVDTVTGAVSAAFHAAVGLISNLFNLAEGIVGLILGNFVIILVGCAAYFGYVQYQRSQGRRVEPITDKIAKKTK